MGYSYFDTPDGQDCGKKLIYTLKKAGIFGAFISTSYVIGIETPPTYLLTAATFARLTTPCLAAAAAGTISICLLVNSRKIDDRRNHLYGGFIGGVVGGLAKGHLGHGIGAGVFLGLIAMAFKDAQLRNYNLLLNEEPKLLVEDHWTKDYDWTLAKKLPKDWIAK